MWTLIALSVIFVISLALQIATRRRHLYKVIDGEEHLYVGHSESEVRATHVRWFAKAVLKRIAPCSCSICDAARKDLLDGMWNKIEVTQVPDATPVAIVKGEAGDDPELCRTVKPAHQWAADSPVGQLESTFHP